MRRIEMWALMFGRLGATCLSLLLATSLLAVAPAAAVEQTGSSAAGESFAETSNAATDDEGFEGLSSESSAAEEAVEDSSDSAGKGSGILDGLSGSNDDSSAESEPELSAAAASVDESTLSAAELAQLHINDLPDGTYRFASKGLASSAIDARGGGTSNGTKAQLYTWNGTDAQVWSVSHDENGYVIIRNAASGLALDVPSGNASQGVRLQLWRANGTVAQSWIAIAQDDGSIVLVSAANTKLAIDLPGAATADETSLQLYGRNDTVAQSWTTTETKTLRNRLDELADANRGVLEDGTYAIVSSLGSRKVLDVASGSTANSANVQLWQSNATTAQRWRVTHDENGYVTFTSVCSGKVLDVANGSASSGANVQQYESNSSYAQKWIVSESGEGSYTVISALSDSLVADISSGSSANGANVQIWSSNGSRAQTFTFVSAAVEAPEPCEDIIDTSLCYALVPTCAPERVIDISSGSLENGANAQIWTSNSTLAQAFCFKYVGGYYLIINVASGKALDVDGGDIVPGTNVAQWEPGDTNANQLFSARDNGDGTYSFINKATGMVLTVAGGASGNGVNLEANVDENPAAQSFSLTSVAPVISEGVYVIQSAKNSSAVLDVASGSLEHLANVQLYASNDTLAQKWYIAPVEGADGLYTIECVNSGMRLAVESNGNVSQATPADDASQYWKPAYSSSGIAFYSAADQSKTLDAVSGSTSNGTNIQVYAANGTSAQSYRLKSSSASPEEGTYTIRMAKNSSKVLDVASGSAQNGANVQIYDNNGSGAQVWTLKKNSDGTFTIINAGSGKALDVSNGTAASGTNVQQWESNSSKAQRWNISYGGGGWRIASALNGSLVLDVASGSTANGANVQIYTSNDSSAQRFTFSSTTYMDPILKNATWMGASYFTYGREGNDWEAIVIHISECPTMGILDSTFTSGDREASAHFGVGGTTVHQYVSLADTAWAVGNWSWNTRTVSIEHVGTNSNPPSYTTLDTSAQLMAALAKLKGWSSLVLGQNVGIHKWYSSTDCPGNLDYTWLVKRANEYLGSNTDGSYVEGAASTSSSRAASASVASVSELRALLDPEGLLYGSLNSGI